MAEGRDPFRKWPAHEYLRPPAGLRWEISTRTELGQARHEELQWSEKDVTQEKTRTSLKVTAHPCGPLPHNREGVWETLELRSLRRERVVAHPRW